MYFGRNDLKKMHLSMARLLTVVNERKRLRGQFRLHLEDEYIRKVKEREFNDFLINRDSQAAKGEKNLPLTNDEHNAKLKEREKARTAKLVQARDTISKSTDNGQGTVAPFLE